MAVLGAGAWGTAFAKVLAEGGSDVTIWARREAVAAAINEHGVRNAIRLAEARGLGERTRFQVLDANQPLPFSEASFDAVVSNDAMCHIGQRLSALRNAPRESSLSRRFE